MMERYNPSWRRRARQRQIGTVISLLAMGCLLAWGGVLALANY